LAAAWNYGGWLRIFMGEHDAAIQYFAHAMRLSPCDPTLLNVRSGTAVAHFFAGRYEDALRWSHDALRDQPNYPGTLRIAAVINAFAGQTEEAQKMMSRMRQLDPELRILNLRDRLPPLRPEDLARYEDGLRKAGLPE
jgi:tetratricopeptide (TPR) repeat protein